MIEQSQNHVKQVEMASNALRNGNLNGLEQQLKEKIEQIEEVNKKLRENEEKSQSQEEDLKSKLNQAQKDLAIKDQKIDFIEIQFTETKA